MKGLLSINGWHQVKVKTFVEILQRYAFGAGGSVIADPA
jgi:hypothetical protein